jgi:3-(3-hydroxy-phenyl)propionate hydroxylase
VNSGRLSRPTVLSGSPLSTPAGAPLAALPAGSPPVDAPVLRAGQPGWLLRHLNPEGRFTLLAFDETGLKAPAAPPGVSLVVVAEREAAPGRRLPGVLVDHSGLAARRWGCAPGEALLLRPDGHVAAGFHAPTPEGVRAAHARALGNPAVAAA